MKRALFIDRDGIFHHLVPWGKQGELCAPRNWDELTPYPEIEGVSELKKLGFALILVTNQPDVTRGITPIEFVEELNASYQRKHSLDAVYVCYHSSDTHPMKKPNPGMFLQAADDLGISLEHSFHLGDTDRDVEGARRAGCRSVLWDRDYNRDLRADFRVRNLTELRQLLESKV